MARRTRSISERFWEKVDKSGECWLWKGAIKDNGYGVLNLGRRGQGLVRAHRLAYELTHGAIPDGLDVCHQCDNRACVNPAHLFLGTRKDNMQDASKKDRISFGSRQPNARLTEGQVRIILLQIREGRTHTAIASGFGVSRKCISKIASGQTWRRATATLA